MSAVLLALVAAMSIVILRVTKAKPHAFMTHSFPPSKSGPGKKLIEALTRDQVESLLEVLAGSKKA